MTTENLMRNPYATHIDYRDFKGLIENNPRFGPSNVDGIVERRGEILVMEWKRDGESINAGQMQLLNALARKESFTVLLIYGSTDDVTIVNDFYKLGSLEKELLGNGLDALKDFYIKWYKNADNMFVKPANYFDEDKLEEYFGS